MIPGVVAASFSAAPATDPSFSSVVALLHFNGADASTTITDVKGKTWTAYGDAQIDTDQSKFGGASALFDGSGDYVETASHVDFAFGSGNFTVELFMRPADISGVKTLFGRWDGGTGQRSYVLFQINDTIQLQHSTNGTTSIAAITTAALLTVGVWTHIAVVRSGTNMHVFVAGVLAGTYAIGATALAGSTRPLQVGYLASPVNYGPYAGHLDEFRVTKGVARYTSAFSPPSAPFPDA